MESIFAASAELEQRGGRGVLCTVVRTSGSTPRHEGSKMLVYADGQIAGSVGGGEVENRVRQEAAEALLDGKSRLLSYSMVNPAEGDAGVCGGTVEVFIEPILPPPAVIVIGGGHVGKAVSHLAHWLGFRVIVSDDRPEMCTLENNPDASAFVVCSMKDLPAKTPITPVDSLVLTTRSSDLDTEGLSGLLDTPAGYIGVIGSRRRWSITRKALLEAGVPQEKLDRVHSPIGLEIKAETPTEIAVSILAEIIMHRKGGTGLSMQKSD